MPRIFLSYVREDSHVILKLHQSLAACGIHAWIDRNDIAPGSRWQDAIRTAIQNGDFFLACFSENYLNRSKTYMNEELTLAIDELRQRRTDSSWFIPVLLSETTVPDRSIGGGERLTDIQHVALHRDWDLGIKQLVSTLLPPPSKSSRLQNRIEELIGLLNCGDSSYIDLEWFDEQTTQERLNEKKAEGEKDALRMQGAKAVLEALGEQALPYLIQALDEYKRDEGNWRSRGNYIYQNVQEILSKIRENAAAANVNNK